MLFRKHVAKEAFDAIRSKKKVYEGRVYRDDWTLIRPGDYIIFFNEDKEVICLVIDCTLFDSFVDMYRELKSDLLPYIHSTEDADNYYRGFFPAKPEKTIAIGIRSVCTPPSWIQC